MLFLCGTLLGGEFRSNAVTMVLDFDEPHSDVSLATMEQEAAAIFKNTGITVQWKLQGSLKPNEEFEDVLVIKMKGQCAMDDVPMPIDERGPMGMAFVSDGEILSFGAVECDHVRTSVQRTFTSGQNQKPATRPRPRPSGRARDVSHAGERQKALGVRNYSCKFHCGRINIESFGNY